MRPIQIADLDICVRVLLAADRTERRPLFEKICADARVADRYRKRVGRCHPQHGTGTLMSEVRHHPRVDRPSIIGQDYLECMQLVSAMLAAKGAVYQHR